MKLRIKYCGGCNPIINRSKLVKEVMNALSEKVNIEIVDRDADVGLLIGGCHVGCVDLSQIKDQARQWIIVSGDLLEYQQVAIGQLPHKIVGKILSVLEKGGEQSC